jgi:formylglycine-generating enzyme required for sulfatase activity
VHCQKGDPVFDEVVKVGSGGSAFWIDRFEASVWSTSDDTGNVSWGQSEGDFPSSFLKNGQWTTAKPPVFALSRTGVLPSRFITWFQANEACRASGKRLPSSDEWMTAVRGTPNSTGMPGTGGNCETDASGLRATGLGVDCKSGWGAEDMVGNLWEITVEWFAGSGKDAVLTHPWPADYGVDLTYGISGYAKAEHDAMPVSGMPSVAVRGGSYGNFGGDAGPFAFDLDTGPSFDGEFGGFRCVIPR